jgi:hypothetical protein
MAIKDIASFLVGYADVSGIAPEELGVDLDDGGTFPLPSCYELRNLVRVWLAWAKSSEGKAKPHVILQGLAALSDFVLFCETARRRNDRDLEAKMDAFARDMESRGLRSVKK